MPAESRYRQDMDANDTGKCKEMPVLLLTGYLGSGKTTLVNNILLNRKGIRFAVIVNDIGEVNIDADLIRKGGVVTQKDESLVALQNGCICCTLKTDLIEQVFELMKAGRFDYIVIEASGICEPEPIARTLCSIPTFGGAYVKYGICRPDCIVTVVDALRMRDEFGCGEALTGKVHGEEDIERLIIQQVEFCNVVLLNKASEVSAVELGRIREIIRSLQPDAEIIECDYAGIDLDRILYTGMFDFDRTSLSAGWIRGIESRPSDKAEREARMIPSDEVPAHRSRDGRPEHHSHCEHHGDPEQHCHSEQHSHCGHHGDPEHHSHSEEYGIGTFVYYRRPAFDINRFDHFIARKWPASVIRAKGICYFEDEKDMSYLFEQAGSQKSLKQAGQWYATAPEEDLRQLMRSDPGFMRDWDETYGDRMQKIVFIGRGMDRDQICRDLDACLSPSLP